MDWGFGCLGIGFGLPDWGYALGVSGEFGFGVPPRGFVTCEGVAAPWLQIYLLLKILGWIWMRFD